MTPHEALALWIIGALLVTGVLIVGLLMFVAKSRDPRPDLRLPESEGEDWRDGVPDGWLTPSLYRQRRLMGITVVGCRFKDAA